MTKKYRILNANAEETRKIATLLTNVTASKILDALSEDKATASELVKKLSLSASTVHYNVKQLEKAGLIKSTHFHYSEKGKVVEHYSIIDEPLIILPTVSSQNMIKSFFFTTIPLLACSLIGAFLIKLFTTTNNIQDSAAMNVLPETEMLRAADTIAIEATSVTAQTIQSEPHIAVWFLAGGLTITLLAGIWVIVQNTLRRN